MDGPFQVSTICMLPVKTLTEMQGRSLKKLRGIFDLGFALNLVQKTYNDSYFRTACIEFGSIFNIV